jgi:hypothetical protein
MNTAISEGYVVEMQSGNQFQNDKIRFTCCRLLNLVILVRVTG